MVEQELDAPQPWQRAGLVETEELQLSEQPVPQALL